MKRLKELLQDGKLKEAFRYIISNYVTLDYIANISGIHWRTLNKYNSDYYEYLNKEDSQKLLDVISGYIGADKLYLADYPNIKYRDYAEQDAEAKATRTTYREKVVNRVRELNAEIL